MVVSTNKELNRLRKRARRHLLGAAALLSISALVVWDVVNRLPEQKIKPQSIEVLGANSSTLGLPPSSSAKEWPVPKPVSVELTSNRSGLVAATTPIIALKVEPESEGVPLKLEVPPEHKIPDIRLQENPASNPNPGIIPEGGLTVLDKTAVQQEEPSSMDDGNFVIQLAALSDPEKALALRAKLSSIGISAHFFKTQILQGEVTRVRVGPFNTRDEAQAILHKLEKVGVNCMIVPN